MDNEEKEYELDEMNVILKIPTEAVEVELTVKFVRDNEIIAGKRVLTMGELFQARRDFLDNVEDGDDYDVRYAITEKGLKYLEELEQMRSDDPAQYRQH